MPKRVPVQSVQVMREEGGKKRLVRPAIGVPFEFTAEELADIKRMSPDAVRTINDESALITSNEAQAGSQSVDASGTTREQKAEADADKSGKGKSGKANDAL